MNNTIGLVKIKDEIKSKNGRIKRPNKLSEIIDSNTMTQETITRWTLEYENLKVAKAWLKNKRNTCVERRYGGCIWLDVTVYAIEYYETDEDGEFLFGSDYDVAEDEK